MSNFGPSLRKTDIFLSLFELATFALEIVRRGVYFINQLISGDSGRLSSNIFSRMSATEIWNIFFLLKFHKRSTR